MPQGSVLGPFLFLLYINDLPKYISPESVARLFADDCVLYRRINSEEDAHKLQKDLDGLHKWECCYIKTVRKEEGKSDWKIPLGDDDATREK